MLTKIRHSIGAIFLILGMCGGDNENLLIPILFIEFCILMIENLLRKEIEDTPYADK